MKNSIISLLLASLLIPLGCTHEENAGEQGKCSRTIMVGLENTSTKTWLDSEVGTSVLPVYWSDGDRINVNGRQSNAVVGASGQKLSRFEFAVRDVEAPFRIVYPQEICGRELYDADGTIKVTLPSQQEYSTTSFGKGAAVLCGYSEGGEITLHNLCGAVKLSFTDDEESTITAIEISSNSAQAPIAGVFKLNPKEETLAAVEGTTTVSLNLKDSVKLSASEKKDFYLVLPAGTYSQGFTITLIRKDGLSMRCNWLRESKGANAGVTIKAGSLVSFAAMDFIPGAKDIVTLDEWKEFVAGINSTDKGWKEKYLGKDSTIRLGGDIALDEDCNTEIAKFPYIFDGQGHTLTNKNLHRPLFNHVSGTIKNLTVAGKMTAFLNESDATTEGAVPLVSYLLGGTLENCTNKVNIEVSLAAHIAASGLVRSVCGGIIRGCVNGGSIKVDEDCSGHNSNVYVAGIVARIHDLSSPVLIENCRNEGEITVNIAGGTASYGAQCAGFGGIAAWLSDGSVEKPVKFVGCSNSASLSIFYPNDTSAPSYQCSLGGILGIGAALDAYSVYSNPVKTPSYLVEMQDCHNSGSLTNQVVQNGSSELIDRKIFTGGLAGSLIGLTANHSKITSCSNTGSLTPHIGKYSRATFCGVCGGLVGLGGYIDINDCTVKATIGTQARQSFAVAGLIGTVLTTFSVSGCKVFADLLMAQVTSYTVGNYGLAVTCNSAILSKNKTSFLSLAGSSIKDSYFGGSLTLPAVVAWNSTATPVAAKADPITGDNYANYIVSFSYTGSDMTLTNNSYWSGL